MATGASPGSTRGSSSSRRMRTMSPSARTSGCPVRKRSGSTVTRPARSVSAPASSPRVVARPEAATPAAQTTVRAGMCSTAAVAGPGSAPPDRRWLPPGLTLFRGTVTPRRSSERAALGGERGGEGPQESVRHLHQQDSRLAGVDRPEVATGVAGDSRRSVRPSPHRSGRRRRPRTSARRRVARDPARPQRPSKARRMRRRSSSAPLQRFEFGSGGLPLVVAEVGVVRASGDDQRVVGDRRGGPAAGRLDLHPPAARSKPVTSASARARCDVS